MTFSAKEASVKSNFSLPYATREKIITDVKKNSDWEK